MSTDRRLVLRCERENANKDPLSNSLRAFTEQEHNARRSMFVDMNPDENWSRRRAVEVHDETADGFFAEYRGDNIFDSPFRYGRHFIDRAWVRCVSQLPSNRYRAERRDAAVGGTNRTRRPCSRRLGAATAGTQLITGFRLRHRG